jgi:hypothetical protein
MILEFQEIRRFCSEELSNLFISVIESEGFFANVLALSKMASLSECSGTTLFKTPNSKASLALISSSEGSNSNALQCFL